MPTAIEIDKTWLIEQYVNKHKSSRAIAKELGCEKSAILRRLKKFNIEPHFNKLDLQGKKIGKLFVIKPVGLNKHKWVIWRCKCDCGTIIETCGCYLTRGTTTSCGCAKRKGQDSPCWRGYKEISGGYWAKIKTYYKRRSRNLPFTITIQDVWDVWEKQDEKCALTGLSLQFAKSVRQERKGIFTVSLDRIDSLKGYVKDNIQWVHKDINAMKWDYAQDYFIKMCELVHRKQTEKDLPLSNVDGLTVMPKHGLWKGYGNISGKMLWEIQNGARKRHMDFDVTIEHLWNLYVQQKGLCGLTGLPIYFFSWKKGKKSDKAMASLDRIDSGKGYIKGNLQWVHKDINVMKYSLDQNRFLGYCSLVYNRTHNTIFGK